MTHKPTNFSLNSKQRILQQSKQQKLTQARQLKQSNSPYQAIQMYHKVLFLSQKPQYLIELAQIYQDQLLDISSALIFYRRALYLKPKNIVVIKQKLNELTKIKGLQLLQTKACKNILEGAYLQQQKVIDYQLMVQFKKIYPSFHQRLIKNYINPNNNNIDPNKPAIKSTLMSSTIKNEVCQQLRDSISCCLGYLQTNSRSLALTEIQNCLLIDDKNVDLLVLKALINWSMLEKEEGYRLFWEGYKINKQHPQVSVFLRLISPRVEELYREAKYDLIEKQMQKCKLKVSRALTLHPYHINLLILRAFLHRTKEQYKQALECLQTANENLQEANKQSNQQYSNQQVRQSPGSIELKSQIALTYNQMAIFLYKQQKYSEAIDLFTEGLKFKPTDYGLLTNRGDCYKSTNDFLKALQDYLKAYQIQTKSQELNFRIATIYNLRAVSLFNSKNYELALKEFNDSLKFTPKNQTFITGKAKCLIQLNRKQQATDLLSQILQQNPNYNQVKSLLSQIKDPQQKRGPNNRKVIQLSKEKF